ncbi:cGMP-specific phosphodiesterase [Stigmatella aurantiaca DW4/3-1]|uniref:cGMP-specific phosphodiesterase n=1 Tax=Stigmatella aurantiaca (strain DW4/3-1) TaxID=378806 RepID=Q08TQ3_STIAD|nr:hypothetical protein [Stigmatella aurantiaca]EAU63856.1 cGMP-specific phosphodiesterase [Stigmatella aurantiaca DW4/3-1]
MNPADLLSAMKRTVEQLAAFNEMAKALTSTLELREVLSLVMQKVSDLLQPRNWSLILQDERSGKLYFEIAVGEGAEALKSLQISPGEGIAGTVFSSGAARLVDDVGGRSVLRAALRSGLGVPHALHPGRAPHRPGPGAGHHRAGERPAGSPLHPG